MIFIDELVTTAKHNMTTEDSKLTLTSCIVNKDATGA